MKAEWTWGESLPVLSADRQAADMELHPVHKLVDPGRIELPPVQCECTVIPFYYGPKAHKFVDGARANVPDLHKNLMIFIRKSQPRPHAVCGGTT